MPSTYCSQCDAVISVNHPRDGDRVSCPVCNVEMEVVSADPFDVYFPFDYDEDWGDGRYEQWNTDWGDNGYER